MFYSEQISHLAPSSNYYSYRLVKNYPSPNPIPAWMGVPHGLDQYYLFVIPSLAQDPEAVQLSKDMIRAWTNFAKTGHPGKMGQVQWTPALNPLTNKDSFTEHMNLDSKNYKMVTKFYSETCNSFWKPKLFV